MIDVITDIYQHSIFERGVNTAGRSLTHRDGMNIRIYLVRQQLHTSLSGDLF